MGLFQLDGVHLSNMGKAWLGDLCYGLSLVVAVGGVAGIWAASLVTEMALGRIKAEGRQKGPRGGYGQGTSLAQVWPSLA